MTTLKVGIASYEEMKARTLAIARGEHRVAARRAEGLVHLHRVLRQGPLRRQPRSAARHRRAGAGFAGRARAQLTGRKKSNLSRTLKTMAGYGLVRLERGERGRIAPKLTHDRIALDLPLTEDGVAAREREAV